jgi:hypothetical protein
MNSQIDSYLQNCNSFDLTQECMDELEILDSINSQTSEPVVKGFPGVPQAPVSHHPSVAAAGTATPRRRKPKVAHGKPPLNPQQLNISELSITPAVSPPQNQFVTPQFEQQEQQPSGSGEPRLIPHAVVKGVERQNLLEKLKEVSLTQFVKAKKLYNLPSGEYFLHFIGHRLTQKFGPYQFGLVQPRAGGPQTKVFLTKLFNELSPTQRGKISPPILFHLTPYQDRQYSELRIIG